MIPDYRWLFKSKAKATFSLGLVVAVILLAGIGCAGRSSGSVSATAEQANPAVSGDAASGSTWSQVELATLRSLWIGSLPPLPPDPSNAVGDEPRAAALGYLIFFDTRFSANGEVSCATCHKPEQKFTDGLPRAEAIGKTDRSTPTLIGIAYSPWFFWDGRRDSQWSQALAPLESLVEHGGTRTQYAHLIAADAEYRAAYEDIFGPLPDLSAPARFPATAGPFGDETAQAVWKGMTAADQHGVNQVYANIGKVIAAYERLLKPGPARFDTYVEALLNDEVEQAQSIFTPEEAAGLKLFITERGQCIRCHNGPLFTSNSFHNIGVPTAPGLTLDYGRLKGAQEVLANEFNCLGEYSDADSADCVELRFIKTNGVELPGAFKVPTLRNVAETAPYMQSGQFAALRDVLQHYSQADPGPLGHNELNPLNLTDQEKAQLVAFLQTLTSPLATDPKWLSQP